MDVLARSFAPGHTVWAVRQCAQVWQTPQVALHLQAHMLYPASHEGDWAVLFGYSVPTLVPGLLSMLQSLGTPLRTF